MGVHFTSHDLFIWWFVLVVLTVCLNNLYEIKNAAIAAFFIAFWCGLTFTDAEKRVDKLPMVNSHLVLKPKQRFSFNGLKIKITS